MANVFSALKKLAGFKKTGTVLGIDIGSSAVKVVELERQGGKAVLKNYGALALGPYAGQAVGQATILPQAKITQAIRDLLQEARITTKNAVFSIPMSSTMISFVEMPALDEKQLNSMIPLEARKYIPVPMSEVMLDWWVIPQESSDTKAAAKITAQTPPLISAKAPAAPGDAVAPVEVKKEVKPTPQAPKQGRQMVDVLIAAIHNDTIKSYDEIKQQTGLEAEMFEIEIFSTIRSVAGDDKEPVMILDMGAGTTKIAIIQHGIIRTTHTIRRGSQDITKTIARSMGLPSDKAEELKRALGVTGSLEEGVEAAHVKEVARLPLSHIFAETNNVLQQYQKKHNTIVKRVVLTGGGALLKGIEDSAKEQIKAVVEIGDPFSTIETPVFLEQTLKEVGPEFAVAIGAALKGLEIQ